MNETYSKIKKHQQWIARKESALSLLRLKERKADTRRKIEFGGLVIKAKMHQYSKAIILGALLSAFEELERETDEAILNIFKAKGDRAFMEFDTNIK
jgi:hypothetical protein